MANLHERALAYLRVVACVKNQTSHIIFGCFLELLERRAARLKVADDANRLVFELHELLEIEIVVYDCDRI